MVQVVYCYSLFIQLGDEESEASENAFTRLMEQNNISPGITPDNSLDEDYSPPPVVSQLRPFISGESI